MNPFVDIEAEVGNDEEVDEIEGDDYVNDSGTFLDSNNMTYLTVILEGLGDTDVEENYSDNRRLLQQTAEEVNDEMEEGFLSHLATKYSKNTSRSTGLGIHGVSWDGQIKDDFELWEVPTRVCQACIWVLLPT